MSQSSLKVQLRLATLFSERDTFDKNTGHGQNTQIKIIQDKTFKGKIQNL